MHDFSPELTGLQTTAGDPMQSIRGTSLQAHWEGPKLHAHDCTDQVSLLTVLLPGAADALGKVMLLPALSSV